MYVVFQMMRKEGDAKHQVTPCWELCDVLPRREATLPNRRPHCPFARYNANLRVGESLEEYRVKAVANCNSSRDHDGKGARLMRRWMTMSSRSVMLLYIRSWNTHVVTHRLRLQFLHAGQARCSVLLPALSCHFLMPLCPG